jgi:hypothetical protein
MGHSPSLFASFVVLRAACHLDLGNKLSSTAIPYVSKRSQPNNKTNNIQRHPGNSMTAYSP